MSAPGWTYNTVDVSFWDDEKVRGWTEDARTLGVYLLTCSHRSSEGFYRLPVSSATDDLRWTVERWEAALAEIIGTDFADYDDGARLVFVCKGLKYHAPMHGRPTIKGALNVLEKAKGSSRLFGRFLEAADKYEPEFAAAIRSKYGLPEGPYQGAS
ncbi:MAG: hypothetical protein RB191_13385 [Terriglobia bacterium]|nr:hypothetical protein [Terriglobia bacterium]